MNLNQTSWNLEGTTRTAKYRVTRTVLGKVIKQSSGALLEDVYNPDETFGNGTDDDLELEHEELQFGNSEGTRPTPRESQTGQQTPLAQTQATNQTPGGEISELMGLVRTLVAENQRLSSESGKRSRPVKEDEEEGEPPVKLHIPEGYDDAWTSINHAARNVRPFCGDWQARYKSLGRKAKPARDTLDWEPMGTLSVANASVRRMHDRGAILTVKMFLPMNHDVSSREARISYKGTDGDFVRESLNYKDPTETWQIVEALHVYTMCLSRVWPEDWTGAALTSILIKYRWIANCGKPKVAQVKLLVDFINTVLSTNATFGRQQRPPSSYAKIKEILANRVWSKGINRESCQTGRDPWSSTPDRSRIPKFLDGYAAPVPKVVRPNPGQGPPGAKRGKAKSTPRGRPGGKPVDNYCRGWNSAAGCGLSSGQCKFEHRCNRSIDQFQFCNKSDHNADSHI